MRGISMVEALNIAIETEKLGIEYYGKLVDRVKEQNLKEFFEHLRQEEARHLVKYMDLKKEYEKKDKKIEFDEESQLYLKALTDAEIFKKAGMTIKELENISLEEAVKRALEFEKQTLLFFYSLWDSVEPEYRDILKKIVHEERTHIARLRELQETL